MNFNKVADGFGQRFKSILKKNKITQAKFGADTNTHAGQISRYIKGERPSGDFILKAVSYFPEEVMYLFFGDVNNQVQEPEGIYETNCNKIVADIESKLEELKRCLSQN